MKKKTKLDLLKELDNYKTFGIQLKEWMEEKGYSRQRLSEELSSKNYMYQKKMLRIGKKIKFIQISQLYI